MQVEFLQALTTMAVFFIAAVMLQIMANRWVVRTPVSQHRLVCKLIVRVIVFVLYVVGVLSALGVLGVNTTSILAGLGLSGFALSYAFKDLITNLLAGMMILLYRPYRVGDEITVSGYSGKVIDIDLRYTHIQQAKARVLVPNGSMLTNVISLSQLPHKKKKA